MCPTRIIARTVQVGRLILPLFYAYLGTLVRVHIATPTEIRTCTPSYGEDTGEAAVQRCPLLVWLVWVKISLKSFLSSMIYIIFCTSCQGKLSFTSASTAPDVSYCHPVVFSSNANSEQENRSFYWAVTCTLTAWLSQWSPHPLHPTSSCLR